MQKAEEKRKNKKKDKSDGFDDAEQEAYEEQLSMKRIENTAREFQLTNFNLTASAILFKEI